MKKKQIAYNSIRIGFKTANTPIDYFKIPVKELEGDGFVVEPKIINLEPNEMLSANKHLHVNNKESETNILNIQVGKGKTTACYELIEKFVDDGYKVIVSSPFKKLVDKDYTELKKRGLSVFQYGQLSEDLFDNYEQYNRCDVQVLTINCLLQNPGDDAYSQAFLKKDYLQKLIDGYRKEKKKVVMFFDEIHESVHNFQRQYIPNLYKWCDLVHKCYVASATFNPASVPVIKYISGLTNGKIKVYETPRIKTDNPSSLHLHIIDDIFSSKNISPLTKIRDIINQNTGKRINILTGYKSIANALVDKDSENDIVKAVLSLNPNITNGDEDVPFDNTRNNIGTTFKTGIDIIEDDAILIVIHPNIGEKSNYGIFSDGLPSIIQSVARIRGAGQVHIITTAPKRNLNKEASFKLCSYPLLNVENANHRTQNELYELLLSQYQKDFDYRSIQIEELSKLNIYYLKLNYTYPSFEEYLINESQNHLVKMHYEYGKELSPYTLWASLHNQFTNTKLTEITHTYRKRTIVRIDKQNIVQNIKKIVSNEQLTEAVKLPLSKAVYYIVEHIGNNIDEDLKFEYKGKSYSAKELQTFPFFMQAIADFYTLHRCNYQGLTKEDYILGTTLQASVQDINNETSKVIIGYKKLNNARNIFIKYVAKNTVKNRKGESIVRKDLFKEMPHNWYRYSSKVLNKIYREDCLVRNKTYKLYNSESEEEITEQMKASIYKEFEKCFTNITSTRKGLNGKKDEYYLIEGSIERQLPKELSSIEFI